MCVMFSMVIPNVSVTDEEVLVAQMVDGNDPDEDPEEDDSDPGYTPHSPYVNDIVHNEPTMEQKLWKRCSAYERMLVSQNIRIAEKEKELAFWEKNTKDTMSKYSRSLIELSKLVSGYVTRGGATSQEVTDLQSMMFNLVTFQMEDHEMCLKNANMGFRWG